MDGKEKEEFETENYCDKFIYREVISETIASAVAAFVPQGLE